MNHTETLLVMMHVTGILVGAFVAWRLTWLRAYRTGMADMREIWMHATGNAHATMLMNIAEERAQMVATFREAIKRNDATALAGEPKEGA